MKQWYTAAELAGLPGLPQRARDVRAKANNENWISRDVEIPTGIRREFHISSLPTKTRKWLIAQAERAEEQSAEEAKARIDNRRQAWTLATDEARDRAYWRRDVVATAAAKIDNLMPKMRAYRETAELYDTSWRSVRRWHKQVADRPRGQWAMFLLDERTGRGRAEIPDKAWEYFTADYLRPEAPDASQCYERLGRIAREEGWQLPCLKTFKRRIARELPPEVLVLKREGEKALERRQPAQIRDKTVFAALEAVNADGHTFDLFVRWPDGTIARPCMVAWQDLLSGKILSYRIDQTENSDAVRLSLGDLVERYGIPKHAYFDNGRAFASKWMTGRMKHRFRFKVKEEDPIGILGQLGVEVHWARPYHGQSKPVERAFRDLCGYVAKHPRFTGAYTGNNPTAKPENYQSRAIDLDVFLETLEIEIREHNRRPGRRSAVCGGVRSFDDVFEASYVQDGVRKATSDQRIALMLAAEQVTVRKPAGHVHLYGNLYWSEHVARMMGKKVVVRFDPQRLQQPVHVYTSSGIYVGAAECVQATGFNDTQAAREHARANRARIKAVKEQAKAVKRMSTLKAAAMLPGLPPEDAPSSPRVVEGVFGRANAKAVGAEEVEIEDEESETEAQFQRAVAMMDRALRDRIV